MIREADSSDFEAIAALEKQVFDMHKKARPDIVKKDPFNREYFENCLRDELIRIFVFEEDGSILGHCKTEVWEYNNHPLYGDEIVLGIDSMCVDEKVRGRQIGRHLFDKATSYAQEIGAARLELTVWDFNKNARSFYEHLGMSARTVRMELMLN